MYLCPTCQASLETDDADHVCAPERLELEILPVEQEPRRPSRPPPARKLQALDGRVDLDALFALPSEKRLYRALPPPPPPPRRSKPPESVSPPERSSIGAVVEDLEPAADLEFEDRPTPVNGFKRVELALVEAAPAAEEPPKRQARAKKKTPEAKTAADDEKRADTSSHAALRNKKRDSGRRGIAGVSIAIGTVALGALAVVMNPRDQKERGLRHDLAPAAQLITNLAPIATTLEEKPPVIAPPTVTAESTTVDTSQSARIGAPWHGGAKGAKSANAASSSAPKSASSAKTKDAETPPHAEATEEPKSDPGPLAPFDADAARLAMQGPKGAAFGCFATATEGGVARLMVTFLPSGQLTNAVVMGPPFGGTPVGACISSKFQGLSVAPFEGSPVTVAMALSAPPPVQAPAVDPGATSAPVAPDAP